MDGIGGNRGGDAADGQAGVEASNAGGAVWAEQCGWSHGRGHVGGVMSVAM